MSVVTVPDERNSSWINQVPGDEQIDAAPKIDHLLTRRNARLDDTGFIGGKDGKRAG